ncbi:hypothetical protein NDU88_003231 [Pleurodeles waltl]|uniref:Uncharacterized protein n=1 Tax=Pleurodeles waltl TaxID=8319 RepID=A0AAV7TNX4_PLEWA|nr:hypothetical protein NDU88_003231 [Pleurodeles waltl]
MLPYYRQSETGRLEEVDTARGLMDRMISESYDTSVELGGEDKPCKKLGHLGRQPWAHHGTNSAGSLGHIVERQLEEPGSRQCEELGA